jgi:hypothetical protein
MTTDPSNKSKFIDYNILIQQCICGHKKDSHQYGMCYGDLMSSRSCDCIEFQLTIDQMEFERISKILSSNTWKETK